MKEFFKMFWDGIKILGIAVLALVSFFVTIIMMINMASFVGLSAVLCFMGGTFSFLLGMLCVCILGIIGEE